MEEEDERQVLFENEPLDNEAPDFADEYLRREGAVAVDRQRMEGLAIVQRNENAIKQASADLIFSLAFLVWIIGCNYIPEWVTVADQPARNPLCKM